MIWLIGVFILLIIIGLLIPTGPVNWIAEGLWAFFVDQSQRPQSTELSQQWENDKHRRLAKIKRRFLFLFLSVLCFFLFCLGLWFPFEAVLYVVVGWLFFLRRSFEEMSLDWNGILTATVCLIGLSLGVHFFLRWIYTQTGRIETQSSERRWQARWTAGVLAVVVLTFTAGVSAVGIVHQSTWLATSPEPIARGSYREQIDRIVSDRDTQNIVTAVQSYHDQHNQIVAGGSFDKNGNGLHGWQTALLPYAEEQHLYDQIKQNMPWHDPANAEVFKKRIQVFQNAFSKEDFNSSGYALSHYASNVRVIGGGPALTFKQISEGDGLANTLLIGEAAGNYKPWGHHANWRDPAPGINQTADGFGRPDGKGAYFAFADGSVHFISDKVSPSVLKALSTPNGGEKIKTEDWQQ